MRDVFEVRGLETNDRWLGLKDDLGGDGACLSLPELFEYLKMMGCRSAILDPNYVDADFRNEYAALYGKTYITHTNLCSRLLFYGCEEATLRRNVGRLSRVKDSYLGFAVIRPTEIGKVGRTLLSPPKTHDGHSCYPVCTGSIPIHFRAEEIPTKGAPYISQDAMVMTCAQCAIWVATSLMSPQLGHRHAFPYEITSAAMHETGWMGRPLPSTGLIVEQMVNCLVKLGYNPIFADAASYTDWNPVRFIYPYIESGIPVMVGVPGHAVTIVGHLSEWGSEPDLSQQLTNEEPSTAGYGAVTCLSSASWSSGFLAQDDNIGPYSVIPSDPGRSFAGTWWERLTVQKRYERYGATPPYVSARHIDSVIVPLPDKVYLTAENCLAHATGLLQALAGGGIAIPPAPLPEWIAAIPQVGDLVGGLLPGSTNPLVLRLYLEQSSRYKAGIPARMKAMPGHIIKRLLESELPHYVWVAELSTKQLFNPAVGPRQALGEIVFDCTANRHASATWIIRHLPGQLVQQTRARDFLATKYRWGGAFGIYTRTATD